MHINVNLSIHLSQLNLTAHPSGQKTIYKGRGKKCWHSKEAGWGLAQTKVQPTGSGYVDRYLCPSACPIAIPMLGVDCLPGILCELVNAGEDGSYALSVLGGTLFYLKQAFLDETLLGFANFELHALVLVKLWEKKETKESECPALQFLKRSYMANLVMSKPTVQECKNGKIGTNATIVENGVMD
ncbi:DNA mismatch repair protein [Forsythia ovata]|uniref:DNA mismatch repair protein n=1 Tax=Forsythia ovata TaxID=205694 RepID=A0ABD1X6I3_9LAMI